MFDPETSREMVQLGVASVKGLTAQWTWIFANFSASCQECGVEVAIGELMLYRFHGLDTVNDWRCRACGLVIKPLPKVLVDLEEAARPEAYKVMDSLAVKQ